MPSPFIEVSAPLNNIPTFWDNKATLWDSGTTIWDVPTAGYWQEVSSEDD